MAGCAYNADVANEDPPVAAGPDVQPAPASAESLSFEKAAYPEPLATKTCAACKQVIPSEYYEVGGQIICNRCRDQLVGATRDRWAFWRALLYGGAAAAGGTLVWSLIIHFTGYELGIIAIVVGVAVGIAVRKGSRGRGGWKYQALAMVLTYVSITTSYVPVIVKSLAQNAKEPSGATAPKAKVELGQPAGEAGTASASPPPSTKTENQSPALPLPIALLAFVAVVWGLALVAPFLAGASNIMGIIIIGIGLYEAWKYNRAVKVSGPFRLAPSPPVAPAGMPTP